MAIQQQTQGHLLRPTERTQIKRLPYRGAYDRATINRILDEGLICHVGFALDGQPYVIPTIYVRVGEKVYFHGSTASRMLKVLQQGIEVCLSVTLVDGLVLARSAFHHSMNYRSVVAFGKASVVEDPVEKVQALRAISEHLIPGRWNDVRSPSEQELRGTLVLSVPLTEASAKIRTGPPSDDAPDYDLPVWAGVIPLRLTAAEPVADPQFKADVPPPPYATHYSGPAGVEWEMTNATGAPPDR